MKISNLSPVFSSYIGDNILKVLDGAQREIVEINRDSMRANYGKTVDGALSRWQVLLCEQTVDYLYHDKIWQRTDYEKGSRPVLEDVVNTLIKSDITQFEKAFRIVRFCRDLYKKTDAENPYDGGTEEELIEKGEHLCECLSRLCVALCEIVGIAGRIITHVGGGHLTCELYVDGKWGYFDPRAGIFFLKSDGNVASVYEILCNPEIIDAQPQWVKNEVSARWTWEFRAKRCKQFFFDKREVNTVKPYSLSDCDSLDFSKRTFEQEWKDGLDVTGEKYSEAICKLFMLDYEKQNPRFEFNVENGCQITTPYTVYAVGKDIGFPTGEVKFYINGQEVGSMRKPEKFAGSLQKGFPLTLDKAITSGKYKLRAEIVAKPSVCGEVEIIIN